MTTSLPCALVDLVFALELEVDEDVSDEAGGDGHGPEYPGVPGDRRVVRVQRKEVSLQHKTSNYQFCVFNLHEDKC